ncbi:MAG: hypothetical protein AAB836_01190 [Patescibacteria group bacterium]
MKNSESISFATDIHGNLKNIDLFLQESKDRKVDHVVFGGDIAPKKMGLRFKDGTGMKMDGPADFYRPDAYSIIQEIPAQDVYEEGYMIFESNFTREQAESFGRIFSKIEQMIDSGGEARNLQMELNDILFLEKNTAYFTDFLCKDEGGKRTFNLFKERIGLVNKNEVPKSECDLFEMFIRLLKYNFLLSSGYLINKDQQILERCLGAGATKKDYLKLLGDGLTFTHGPVSGFLRSIMTAAPWNEWLRVRENLLPHSDEHQRKFMTDFLQRIRRFRQIFHGSISIILGNDDAGVLHDDLEAADKEGILHNANNKTVKLSDEVQMLGYSYVPHIHLEGIHDYWFKQEEDIKNDMNASAANLSSSAAFTIANIHCPPEDTNLDMARERKYPGRQHWGSAAVRDFLEQTGVKIDLALFGHIHESASVSGSVQDKVGETICYNPGASEYKGRFIFINTGSPSEYHLTETGNE